MNYWVVKADSAGSMQWDKTIGGSDNDFFTSMDNTADSGYIVAGYSLSKISGEKTENSISRNFYDYWIVKLQNNGKLDWDKTIGTKDNEIASDIRELSKNHYVLAGESQGGKNADKKDTSRGDYDYWLVYLNYNKPLPAIPNSISVTKQNLNNNFSIYPNPAKDILHVQTNGKATISVSDQSGKLILTKNIDVMQQ